MRILILANNDIGLYNFRKELIERLVEEENEIFISLPNGERIKDLKDLGCEFIETNIDRRGTNPIKDFKLIFKYRKILKKINPEIVLTYTIKPNIYGGLMCRIKKIPYICNITGLGTSIEDKGLMQKMIFILYKIALKNVKCCFVQNNENLQFLVDNKLVDKEKCKLIPGSGVNLEHFKVLPYPEENENIKFLFISRIMKEKGIEQYLEAAINIKEKYKNIEFHILGFCEQDYEEKLKRLMDEGTVIYHGLQKDVIPFLEKASCLVHPSYYPEGMSNVLLEASASGRPVITTDRSGCREVVEDKKTGYIIDVKSAKQLIEKIEEFLKLPNEQKKQMGLEARKKVEREFDRNIVINEYIKEIGK